MLIDILELLCLVALVFFAYVFGFGRGRANALESDVEHLDQVVELGKAHITIAMEQGKVLGWLAGSSGMPPPVKNPEAARAALDAIHETMTEALVNSPGGEA
jgi:hypothetical protein